MKKNILTSRLLFTCILLSALALNGCKKKSDSSASFYMKFKVDGTAKSFSGETAAVFTALSGVNACSLVGEVSTGDNNGMGIALYSESEFAAGASYTDAVIPTVGTPGATLVYTDDAHVQFSSILASVPGVTVTITELTADHVKGTFSGKVRLVTGGSTEYSITEGEFNIKRI